MKKIYALRNKLCDQLEGYSDKELNNNSLEVVDKLAHAIKNIDKIIEKGEEQEYSNSYGNGYYRPSYGMMYDDGMSHRAMPYSRDRGYGRGSSNSYGRGYSNDNDIMYTLNELMEDTSDERTRKELQKFIQKMQSM